MRTEQDQPTVVLGGEEGVRQYLEMVGMPEEEIEITLASFKRGGCVHATTIEIPTPFGISAETHLDQIPEED